MIADGIGVRHREGVRLRRGREAADFTIAIEDQARWQAAARHREGVDPGAAGTFEVRTVGDASLERRQAGGGDRERWIDGDVDGDRDRRAAAVFQGDGAAVKRMGRCRRSRRDLMMAPLTTGVMPVGKPRKSRIVNGAVPSLMPISPLNPGWPTVHWVVVRLVAVG